MAALAASLAWAGPAGAGEVVVRARSEVGLYGLPAWRLRWDDQLGVSRQRVYQRLYLGADELFEREGLRLEALVRVGSDLGWRPGEPEALDGASRYSAELLVGALRWRPAGRPYELALGRLLKIDGLDFRYIDGAEAGLALGPVRVAAYGGALVKDGSFLGSPNFEPDGVRSSDDALAARSPEGYGWAFDFHDAPALTYGAELGLRETFGVQAGVGYHRAESAGAVDFERATASLQTRHGPLSTQGQLSYDLYLGRVAQAALEARLELGPAWALGAGAQRYQPTFDADSIFNHFNIAPMDELSTELAWRPSEAWRLLGRARARRYSDPIVQDSSLALGGELQAGWWPGAGRRLRLMLSGLSGHGGTQLWSRVEGQAPLWRAWEGALSLAAGYVHDPGLAQLQTPILGARAGLAYRFDVDSRLSFVIEHNSSQLAPSDLRLYATLDLGLVY